MERFNRFALMFFVVVVSLCAGKTLQANTNDGCDGAVDSYRKIVEGEKIQDINIEYYGSANHIQMLAQVNNLKRPGYKLSPGMTLQIPCLAALRKPASTAVVVVVKNDEPKPMESKTPSTSVEIPPTPVVSKEAVATEAMPPAEIISAWEMKPENVTTLLKGAQPSPAADHVANKTAALVTPKKATKLKSGWYVVELNPEAAKQYGFRPGGYFPALSMENPDKDSGLWKGKRKTEAVITVAKNGNVDCLMEFKTPPSTHSLIVIDIGEGNTRQFDGAFVSANGRFISKSRPSGIPKYDYNYDDLDENPQFLRKASDGFSALKNIAIPTAIGGITLGPVGAAVSFTTSTVRYAISKKQKQREMRQTNVLLATIRTQGEQINALNQRIVSLEKKAEAQQAPTQSLVAQNK
jgi:hypothetical protein